LLLAQLNAEKAIRKYVKGRGAVREWVKLRERNEALDLEVYALAGLYLCGAAYLRGLGTRAATLARAAAPQPPQAQSEARPPTSLAVFNRRRRSWVHGW
jgi:phage terminase large subunit GpA-like protein